MLPTNLAGKYLSKVNIRDSTAMSMEEHEPSGQMCDALRDLIPFARFKKREKHPWKSVTFSKVAA